MVKKENKIDFILKTLIIVITVFVVILFIHFIFSSKQTTQSSYQIQDQKNLQSEDKAIKELEEVSVEEIEDKEFVFTNVSTNKVFSLETPVAITWESQNIPENAWVTFSWVSKNSGGNQSCHIEQDLVSQNSVIIDFKRGGCSDYVFITEPANDYVLTASVYMGPFFGICANGMIPPDQAEYCKKLSSQRTLIGRFDSPQFSLK